MLSAAEEIRFWTGIMRDHGEFILSSLSYNEKESIVTAGYFKESFAKLHEQSKSLVNASSTNDLNILVSNCMTMLMNFINFKRLLLRKLLECKLNTSLPPTFYNHMINEAMEFYNALYEIRTNAPVNPTLETLKLHKIWLPDAAGHAASIAGELDPVEFMLIKEAQEFEKSFNCLSIKADELEKMLKRTCLDNGTLKMLNEEVNKEIEEFICFLDKVRMLRAKCKVMGTLKPLVPDHMIREERYYLAKVASLLITDNCKHH